MGGSLSLLKGTLVELKNKNSRADYSKKRGEVETSSCTEENRSRQVNIEDYQTLKIATHNINRIKGSFSKLDLILEWAKKESIDIVGINESNTTEKQNKFNTKKQEEFFGVWSDAEYNKKKGSGVGLLINKK